MHIPNTGFAWGQLFSVVPVRSPLNAEQGCSALMELLGDLKMLWTNHQRTTKEFISNHISVASDLNHVTLL